MLQRPNLAVALAATFVLSTPLLFGCNSGTSETAAGAHAGHDHGHDHEHGHRPDSLHEAVEQLAGIEIAISEAITSGDVDAAHGPLHEVGELLQAIPEVAAETDLPKEEWEAVKAATDRLFGAYAVIDKAFHVKDGDKQAAYEQVASELTEALEEIRSRLPMTGEEGEDHDHDHGDHDHGDHDHEEHDHEEHADHDHEEDGTDS